MLYINEGPAWDKNVTDIQLGIQGRGGYGRAPHLNSKFINFHAVLSMGVLDSAMFLCRHNQVHTSHYVIIICSGSWLCDFLLAK